MMIHIHGCHSGRRRDVMVFGDMEALAKSSVCFLHGCGVTRVGLISLVFLFHGCICGHGGHC